MKNRNIIWLLTVFAFAVPDCPGQVDENEPATAIAPAGFGILEHVSTGVFYADKNMLARYNELVDRVKRLRKRIATGDTSTKVAQQELQDLRDQLTVLRELIDDNKVLVEPYKSYSKTEEIDFPLSESGMIVITADNVRIKGWDGPGIRCVMEKTVLSSEEPDESEFAGISVKHALRVADDWVGQTDEARMAGEKKFLDSEQGQQLSDSSKANRARLVAEIHGSYSMYKPFQGELINTLLIDGLTFQKGNRMIEGNTKSPGGAATSGGYWKRAAKVTVLVPPCKQVAVRGCQVSIYINEVKTNLVLTNHGSRDRDYNGTFVVDDVEGDVVVHQAPIRSLTNIRGTLTVTQNDEFCDRSTMHSDGYRTIVPAATAKTTFRAISGDVNARILRTDLELREIGGTVDVQNDYGDTKWFIENKLKEAPHRLMSHSGAVEFITAKASLAGIPVYAFSQAGVARTTFTRQQFEDRSFSTGGRGWYGFNTAGATADLFQAFTRHRLAVENVDRADGIDLISHAGDVTVDRRSSAQ